MSTVKTVKEVKTVKTVKPVEGFLKAAQTAATEQSVFAPGIGEETITVMDYVVREHEFKQQGLQQVLDIRGKLPDGKTRIRSFPAFIRTSLLVATIMSKHGAAMNKVTPKDTNFKDREWIAVKPFELVLVWENIKGIQRVTAAYTQPAPKAQAD